MSVLAADNFQEFLRSKSKYYVTWLSCPFFGVPESVCRIIFMKGLQFSNAKFDYLLAGPLFHDIEVPSA